MSPVAHASLIATNSSRLSSSAISAGTLGAYPSGHAQPGPLQFDFIYADTWPGKFTHLDVALSLLRVGGIYLIDDLLPQPSRGTPRPRTDPQSLSRSML